MKYANRKLGIIGGATAMLMLAANKGGATGGAATATGTGPKTEAPKTDAKTEKKVEVNTKLLDLFKKYDASAEKTASLLVDIGEFVQRENISNPVLIKTIMEARGIKEDSAKSQASRIRSLLKDEESFAALKRGEITVRAAVKGAQARRAPNPANNAKKFDASVNALVVAAKAVGQDKKTILTTVEAALDKGGIK